jgi:hypothetical protein
MRSALLSATVLTMLAACLAAGETGGWNYRGKVVDAKGMPLAGVKVSAYASVTELNCIREIGASTTGEDGAFSFTLQESPPGAFVIARKDGFSCGWRTWYDDPRMSQEPARIELGKPAALSGVVVDVAGKPVPAAAIRLVLESDRFPRTTGGEPADWLATKTGTDGRFVFPDLPAGARATFLVDAPEKASLPGYSAGEDQELQYTPGQKGIRLVLKPEGRIEGTLLDPNGNAIAGTLVRAYEGDFTAKTTVTTEANGRFVVGGLDAGKHSLRLVSGRAPADFVAGRRGIAVENGRTTSGVKLQARAGGLIEVTVTDANDRSLAGASVNVQQQPVAEGLGDSGYGATDDKGTIRFRLEPGLYETSAYVREFIIASVKDSPVEEGKTRQVKIRLKPELRIRLTAVDEAGKPVAGATAVLFDALGMCGPRTTDANGAVWFVPFVSSAQVLPAVSGTVLVRHAGRGLVAHEDYSSADGPLRITLAPGATLKGRVVDPEEKPIAGAKVAVQLATLALDQLSAVTDAQGHYQILAVPPGYCAVTAEAEGFGVAGVSTKAGGGAGPDAVEAITLKPAKFSVSGIVKDEDGNPVAGASVSVQGLGQPGHRQVKTDKEGRFTIDKIVEGEVGIEGILRSRLGWARAKAGDKDVEIVIEKPPAPASAPAGQLGIDF